MRRNRPPPLPIPCWRATFEGEKETQRQGEAGGRDAAGADIGKFMQMDVCNLQNGCHQQCKIGKTSIRTREKINQYLQMEVIYRLADDVTAIAAMQKASLSNDGPGLRQTHGLICSPEWWMNVQSGALETQMVRGVIRGIWFGQYHSGPAEFQMELADGTLFGGHCYLDPEDADSVFTLGRIAEVDYVHQYPKTSANSDEPLSPIWLEIRLGDTVTYQVSPLPNTEKNFGRFTQRRNESATHVHPHKTKNPWWVFWR